MKSFYGGTGGPVVDSTVAPPIPNSFDTLYIGTRASVAVYDGPASAPYVEYVAPCEPREFIESLASKVYHLAKRQGSSIPYTAIRELTENFIHAGFAEPVVSVLESGTKIRFSDQGPGISDKRRALEPGFTTATSHMKDVIRGVGSGLPLVRDFLSVSGGELLIEDNLGRGCVVTISQQTTLAEKDRTVSPVPSTDTIRQPVSVAGTSSAATPSPSSLFTSEEEVPSALPPLTNRQKQVLALVLENGAAGPSIVSRELGVGLSTAYRDLASLEDSGLISSDSGKRTLTPEGINYLTSVLSSR